MRKFVLGLFALYLVIVCCQQVAAVTWLCDNFNSYTLDNLTNQGGWTGIAGPIKVQDSFAAVGKAVEMDYLISGTGEVNRSVFSSGGRQYIDFDVAMDIDGTAPYNTNLGYIKIYDTSSSEITRFYFAKSLFKVLLGATNQNPVLENVINRKWYHIRLAINLSTSKIDVWVDGVPKVTAGTTHSAAFSIGKITIGNWNQGSTMTRSKLYVDNITCNSSVHLSAGSATKILSPRFFPGWQYWNVCYPYAFYDDTICSYRMYYTGSGAGQINDSTWDQWATGVVTSTDTIKWAFPDSYEAVLYPRKFAEGEVVDPEEHASQFDSLFAYGACIIRNGPTYQMWYTGWNGETERVDVGRVKKINFRIGYATSPDGIKCTKFNGGGEAGSIMEPGDSGQPDSKGVGQPHVIKEGDTYRMWYEGYNGNVWRILYATSTDGINWTRQGTPLNPGDPGALDEKGLRNPVVITRNGGYELWYQGQSASSPQYHILRATSLDGIAWTKLSNQVVLHPDTPVTGDEKIHVDSIIVHPDNYCQVFFAKETTTTRTITFGTTESKYYHIYTEVLNP